MRLIDWMLNEWELDEANGSLFGVHYWLVRRMLESQKN